MTAADVASQVCIALAGLIAVRLSQDLRANWRRWACIPGLLGQPGWLYSTWVAQQYGIFLVCILYTYIWGESFYKNWIKRTGAPLPDVRNKRKTSMFSIGKKTVNQVVNAFQKAIDELKIVEEENVAEAERLQVEIEQSKAQLELANREAERAVIVSGKLQAIFA